MNGYNFTERVRKVLAMAREEAARLHHEYVGTEHILLGLIREGEGVAAAVLQNLNVDLDDVTPSPFAERYAAQGWPASVKDGALTAEYSAPSAGPPPWYLYVVAPVTAFGVLTTEPGGATRWRFDR